MSHRKMTRLNVDDRFFFDKGRRIFDKTPPQTKSVGANLVEVPVELPLVEDDRADFNIRHREWNLFFSGAGAGVALTLIVNQLLG